MIKVYLNDLSYRYDVFQIVNLYFANDEIVFTEEHPDFVIHIEDETITIKDDKHNSQTVFEKELTKKEEVKLTVFNFLRGLTKKQFPWGTLVGIRPSKIALAQLMMGKSEKEIIEHFNKHFLTNEEKAKLCIEVSKKELSLVNAATNTISVYIGMPFCPTRCLYCSFASNPIASCRGLVQPYLQALEKEITSLSQFIDSKELDLQCVYFGGGTPTSISNEQFESLMKHIHSKLIAGRSVKEFTVECGRPDSITYEKLMTMKKYGTHRISINPQSMNDTTLKSIGRNHTAMDVMEKFNMARNMGFDNINMDVIVGLEGEDLSSVAATCNKIFELDPDSITVHGLSVKRASKLHERILGNNFIKELEQSEINKMYEEAYSLSLKLNMKPYYMYRQKNMFGNMENVGYAKHNKESLYNIQMIEEKQTIIGLGADAVTKVVFLDENRIERFGNVKDVKEYGNRIDEMIVKKISLLNTLYKD